MSYYPELKKRLIECSKMSVPINKQDRLRYKELFEANPGIFKKNATKQYYFIMKEYILNGKVWKNNLMGRVRHGKSEVAQTWTMLYIDEFNEAITKGFYKELVKQGIKYNIKKLPKLSEKEILFSQGQYLYDIRELERRQEMLYGQPRIVDEDEESTGGTGSYSERIELDNVANITAQALQSEWQLRPDRFVLRNAPFGLYQEKMDRENKINWSMLYELRNDPASGQAYIFVGWVATPLHEDDELRKKYNKAKKENILKVIRGEGDPRLQERYKVIKLLSEDKYFSMRTESGKSFKLSKQQQESLLNEWILEGKVQNFNSIEKFEMIEHARLLVEKKLMEQGAE